MFEWWNAIFKMIISLKYRTRFQPRDINVDDTFIFVR